MAVTYVFGTIAMDVKVVGCDAVQTTERERGRIALFRPLPDQIVTV